MSKTPTTKEQLLKTIAQIQKSQKAEVFCDPAIAKILGTPKKWKALNKSELCLVIDAWKQMLSACPQTANWLPLRISSRIFSLVADGVRWVDYFGFASKQEAEAFLENIMPDCKWAAIRQGGKRVNASFECKVWGLSSEKFQSIVANEKMLSGPQMTFFLMSWSTSSRQVTDFVVSC
ncbi:hypothetical protein [Phormidium nigroviride]